MSLPKPTSSGRIWLGHCLTIAAPAVGWVLEDRGLMKIQARMICLAVLVAGVLLSAIGTMGRDRESSSR